MPQTRRRFLGAAAAGVALAAGGLFKGSALAEPGTRSGMPWPSGASSWTPDDFATWRGRPLDVLTTFITFDTWYQLERLARPYTLLGKSLQRPERLVVTLPMFPAKEPPNPNLDPTLWAKVAAGSCADHWRRGMDNLHRAAPRDDYIFRVGHEWNGGGNFPWVVRDGAYAQGYIESFRLYVGIIREFFPNALIDWCGMRRTKANADIDAFYPGGDVVDFVGHDHYDRNPAATSLKVWRNTVNKSGAYGPEGMGAWLAYAKSKNKKMSIPEWAVWSKSGGGAGDNPLFIDQMTAFFAANADWIGYECYFHQDGGTAQHGIGPNSNNVNPLAGDAYLKRYWPGPEGLARAAGG
ncbi:MAG: twin-arginine translocation signal domain-containing protein [Geminicoccaceae bacterium]|nr:twin-arginine translocation signal domain-containing protein [Geminicoccaceae bacterium]